MFAGKGVTIFSEISHENAGQILGQVLLLEGAQRRAGDLKPKDLLQRNDIAMATFHDGGQASRFSPLTLGLNDARGRQYVGGTYTNSSGEQLPAELLPLVMTNSSDFARTLAGTGRSDVFWTSQIVAGAIRHDSIQRGSVSYAKFFVPIDPSLPDEELLKQFRQFGTIVLDEEGNLKAFYGNQDSGAVDVDKVSGKLVWSADRKHIKDDLFEAAKDGRAGFDYGSFSMSNDLMRILWDYWINKKDESGVSIIDNCLKTGRLDKKWKRDIDPDFTQPLTFLLRAIAEDPSILDGIPSADVLRADSAKVAAAIAKIRTKLPENVRLRMGEVKTDKNTGAIIYDGAGNAVFKEDKPSVTETIEIFLTNRDRKNIFGELTKKDLLGVVGAISLGANADWQTYRSAIDITNEKLFMLTDMTGKIMSINTDGELEINNEPKIGELRRAENLRNIKNIPAASVCDFYVNGKHVVLSVEEVTGEEPVVVEGVTIHNAIIQNAVLLSGSSIIDSVVENSQGLIDVNGSYVERCTVKKLTAQNCLAHKVISTEEVDLGKGRLVTDVFRPGIKDARFPNGQTRVNVPVKYDPKTQDKTLYSDENWKNAYALDDIRKMPCIGADTDSLERQLRNIALKSIGVLVVTAEAQALADREKTPGEAVGIRGANRTAGTPGVYSASESTPETPSFTQAKGRAEQTDFYKKLSADDRAKYMAALKELDELINAGKPIEVEPFFKLGIGFDNYNWGQSTNESAILKLMGLKATKERTDFVLSKLTPEQINGFRKFLIENGIDTPNRESAIRNAKETYIAINSIENQDERTKMIEMLKKKYMGEFEPAKFKKTIEDQNLKYKIIAKAIALKCLGEKSEELLSFLTQNEYEVVPDEMEFEDAASYRLNLLNLPPDTNTSRVFFNKLLSEQVSNGVVAERWFQSGTVNVNGFLLPAEVLSFWPNEVYGEKHVNQHGRANDITGKHLDSRQNLSLQMHGFDEMISGVGVAYIGFKQDVTPEQVFKACMDGTIVGLLNEVTLDPGKTYVLPAYTVHAYGKVTVFETKGVSPEGDAKGTISFFDRLKYRGDESVAKYIQEAKTLKMTADDLRKINKGREKKDVL
ncbi:MAG: hypothetical protein PHW46_05845, partial [Candidatus Omnitrophica bacterium]|nr:hypothetical protein [Candidatus Omnitrophota bacterium]